MTLQEFLNGEHAERLLLTNIFLVWDNDAKGQWKALYNINDDETKSVQIVHCDPKEPSKIIYENIQADRIELVNAREISQVGGGSERDYAILTVRDI